MPGIDTRDQCARCKHAVAVRRTREWNGHMSRPVLQGVCGHDECTGFVERVRQPNGSLMQRVIENQPPNEKRLRGMV